ncbi:MAG: selenium metabolism-associated LysR family transcriptional regulator [Syntrophales bacterium]|nr:selenium metabolism-associated LysR family transcriptional regulator [Syntrophales bacterium]
MKKEDLKNMTLQQLESLVLLTGEGTFSRAAKKMNLSQPSLTKHIQNMEELLDAPIVIRRRSGVILTPEGKILCDYARKILKSRDEAAERMVRLYENEGGEITIAASTMPAAYILPRILVQFREVHPKIMVYVRSADSQEVLETIESTEKEIGFVGKKPSHGKLDAEPIWMDTMVLAVPAGHPWAGRTSVSLAELMVEPFIVREKGSGTRAILEQYLKEKGTSVDLSLFRVVAELGSTDAVKEAILAGLGVSLISARAVKREVKLGLLKVMTIEDWKIERQLYLIRRRNTSFMRHHQVFLEFVKNYRLEDLD